MEGQGFEPKLPDEDAMNWCYRGEGAANIVLAYQGTHPFLVGKVLRLKKIILDGKNVKNSNIACISGNPILTEQEQKVWKDWPSVAAATSFEKLIHAYTRDVMSPLLGTELVDPGVVVQVSSIFLERVAHNVHHARQSWRIDGGQIDIHGSCALLISDHSLFHIFADAGKGDNIHPSISIEIKPKCGFLPSSPFIAPQNSIKKKISRFTMHQYLKLSEGQVEAPSHYSPLDLFSEKLDKINQAVHDLFDTPQNNLRVFVGGASVDSTISKLNAVTADWQALREALTSCICSEDQADPVEILKEVITKSLHGTDALKNLLAAQKLDTRDIEGAIHAYYKLSSSLPVEVEESRQIVRDYLIAATAKDCSLMLTFQQAPDALRENANMHGHKVVCSSKIGKYFYSKIKFVDLDLKPLSKMPHYLHIDQEIVRAFLTATHDKTKCCEVMPVI